MSNICLVGCPTYNSRHFELRRNLSPWVGSSQEFERWTPDAKRCRVRERETKEPAKPCAARTTAKTNRPSKTGGANYWISRPACSLNAAYRATTLRDISKAAGILPGSVYYHFDSKAELFVEVNEEGFRSLIAGVKAAIASETEPWPRLEAAFATHLEQLVSGQAIASVTNAAILSPEETRLLTPIRDSRKRYETIIEDLVGALPLKPGIDRRLLRLQLLGALNWTAVWYRPGKKSPAEIAHNLIESIRL